MNSVNQIFELYPKVKEKVNEPTKLLTLSNEEFVFFQMVLFFKDPKSIHFSLNMIYEYLRDEKLLLAIQILIEFFQKDTNFVKNVAQSYYTQELNNERLVGQKKFSEMVQEALPDVKFAPSMVHTYWKRDNGKVPNADLIIDSTPYWTEKTVNKFIEVKKVEGSSKKK